MARTGFYGWWSDPVMLNGRHTEFVANLTLDKCSPALGESVRQHLVSLGLETNDLNVYSPGDAHLALENGIAAAFHYLGIPNGDPSTQDTPRRFATMMVGELTKGLNYDFFPKCTTTPNGEGELGKGAHDEMVVSKNIETISLCEHHLQTIYGLTHIAYIPRTKVLGLSKFARVTDFFARRPQIQERLTDQIYHALAYVLETEDIAVVIDAEHFCMKARGAMQAKSSTQTNKCGGRFLTNQALREEFLHAIASGR